MWGKYCEVYAPIAEKVGEDMKAENREITLQEIKAHKTDIWLCFLKERSVFDTEKINSFYNWLIGQAEKVDQLEAKAEELDKREKGLGDGVKIKEEIKTLEHVVKYQVAEYSKEDILNLISKDLKKQGFVIKAVEFKTSHRHIRDEWGMNGTLRTEFDGVVVELYESEAPSE